MILMAGMELPLSAVREHIASSVQLIVQQARMSDGRRVVTAITEVTGMEGDRIQTQDLFRYVRRAVGGVFLGCGTMPTFADRWRDAGRPLDPALFANDATGTLFHRQFACAPDDLPAAGARQ
jgi:pilus assembly protein CpaF